jgi:catechol-2,3-dioxygenase
MHIRPRQEDRMRVTHILANLRVANVRTARSFYTDYLGLSTKELGISPQRTTIPSPNFHLTFQS